jgi:hypothetical protein
MTSFTERGRRALALVASAMCVATAVAAFWYQDWRYSLPTPRPEGLSQPALGASIDTGRVLGRVSQRPTLIHVVNVDCPCSRFNVDHVRSLLRRFGDRVSFIALVQGTASADRLLPQFTGWGLPMEAVADTGGTRAAALGVYSTPQAVLLTADRRLYFRGNYNSSRYCVDRQSEYVRIAIEALLAGLAAAPLPEEATIAYGCPLPSHGVPTGL